MKVIELMHTYLITTSETATIAEAVDKMDLYQLSGLPVVDDDKSVVGMITEYDIIRLLLPDYAVHDKSRERDVEWLKKQGADIANNLVKTAMTTNPITIDENETVETAARLMLNHHIKTIPVTSEGKLVGVIKRIDICSAVLEGTL